MGQFAKAPTGRTQSEDNADLEIDVEKALSKLAQKLMAYDQDSLANLWEKYAEIVQQYEPTKRWEEAVIILGLIQTVCWKNQLFNYHWKERATPGDEPVPPAQSMSNPFLKDGGTGGKRGKLLRFRPRKDDESV